MAEYSNWVVIEDAGAKENVSDMSTKKDDDDIAMSEHKESKDNEVAIGGEENEPDELEEVDDIPEGFFDEMLQDDFFNSMAVVDAWDENAGSDTEKIRHTNKDDLKDKYSDNRRHDKRYRSPDDKRRDLKRDSRDGQDRNKNTSQNRNNEARSVDRNWNNRDRHYRKSRDRSADRNMNNRDRQSRRSRDRSVDRNLVNRDRQNRKSRDRSADRNLVNRDRQNRKSRDRSADRNLNRDRQNRKSRDRSADRNLNRDRQSRDRSADRNLSNRDRQNRKSRDRSADRNLNRDRQSRDRSADVNRDRQNRKSRDRSADRNLNRDRQSRDRSADRNLSNRDRKSRDRSADRNLNRDRQSRKSRDRSADGKWNSRDRQHRRSKDRSADRNLNSKDKQNRRSRDRSTDRQNRSRNTGRKYSRERSRERRETNGRHSSEKGDRTGNRIDTYSYREKRNEDRDRKERERRSSVDIWEHKDERNNITESSSLDRRKGEDRDQTKRNMEGNEADRKSSTKILEGKKDNVSKLDTCIKQLDDLLPPGTEDEFVLPRRGETLKLTEGSQKKNSSSSEKQNSDKVSSYDRRIKSYMFGSHDDDKDRQQRRDSKERETELRFGRYYKDDKYAGKWEDRKYYNDEADRKKEKTGYKEEDIRIRSENRERKRALSRDRHFSWSDCKRRRSLSKEKYSERNIRHHSREKPYKEDVKSDRRIASGDKIRKLSQRERNSKDKDIYLSPVSDTDSLSTPTLSSDYSPISAENVHWESYGKNQRYEHGHSISPVSSRSEFSLSHSRSHPKSCTCVRLRRPRSHARSRSRSLDSFTSLSSDSPYRRPRRKRSPFLKELERKLRENHNKKANSELMNFSFAALYQNSSSQQFGASTSYPAPAVYSHPPGIYSTPDVPPPTSMPNSYIPNYPPPTVASDFSQSYVPTDMSQTSQMPPPSPYLAVPPNFSETSAMPPGPVPPNFSDGSLVQMPDSQPVQMPMQLSVPPSSQFMVPPPQHMQLPMPPPSQLPEQLVVPLPVQSPAQSHFQQLSGPPSTPVHLDVPSSQLPAQPHMQQLPVPLPSYLPVPSSLPMQMPQHTTTTVSHSLHDPSQSYPQAKPLTTLSSSENFLEGKAAESEKSQGRRAPREVPPPPKLSELYKEKATLSSILEASVKVPVASTEKQMSVNPELISRCEETLFNLQAVNDPSFLTPGPFVVQDSSRYSTKLQDIPDHLKKYQSPLLRKPEVRLNFTNHLLYEEFSVVSSGITTKSSASAAKSPFNISENAHDVRVKDSKCNDSSVQDPSQDSKHNDSSVKDSNQDLKRNDSSVKDSNQDLKHNDSSVKDPKQDSKHNGSSVKDPKQDSKRNGSSVKDPKQDSKHNDSSVKDPKQDSKYNDLSVKDPKQDSKHNDSSVKDPKQHDSSIEHFKYPEPDGKASRHYRSKASKKHSAPVTRHCSVCLERSNKIMIWNATQTPKVEVKSVGIQVFLPERDSEQLFGRNHMWRSEIDREVSCGESVKGAYTSEQYRQHQEDGSSFYRSLTPTSLQKSSLLSLRQPFSSGLTSTSLASTPRKGILKSSSTGKPELTSLQSSYQQPQSSSLSADFKAVLSSRGEPGPRLELSRVSDSSSLSMKSDLYLPREVTVNKFMDFSGNKSLPSAHSLLGQPKVSYPLPFRSTSTFPRSSSYDLRSSLTSGSRFDSSLTSSQSPAGFHGKSTSAHPLSHTTFDYQHSDKPTQVMSDPSSRL